MKGENRMENVKVEVIRTITDEEYDIINDMSNLIVSFLNTMTIYEVNEITLYNEETDNEHIWTVNELRKLLNMVDSF